MNMIDFSSCSSLLLCLRGLFLSFLHIGFYASLMKFMSFFFPSFIVIINGVVYLLCLLTGCCLLIGYCFHFSLGSLENRASAKAYLSMFCWDHNPSAVKVMEKRKIQNNMLLNWSQLHKKIQLVVGSHRVYEPLYLTMVFCSREGREIYLLVTFFFF